MEPLELFLRCVRATRNSDVEAALDEFADAHGRQSYRDLTFHFLGGRDNNRGPIEAMSDTRNAIYEKVMNGFDAVIDLYDRHDLFETNPTNASEALREIGADLNNPGVYLITSKANTRMGERGSPKKRANVLICDEGTGIVGSAFKSSILSIEGSNKAANRLMAGSYGMGGSAIYASSEFSLIYSVAESDPGVVTFTVVYKIYRAHMIFPSYVALTDDSEEPLQFDVAELPSNLVVRPNAIDAKNAIEFAREKIILPEHGTGVKVFELEGFTSSQAIYSYLRDRGFGMAIPCRFRNGVPVQEIATDEAEVDEEDSGTDEVKSDDVSSQGQTRRRYDVLGTRLSLSDSSKRGSYPIVYSTTQPIMFEDGRPQATLRLWVVQRAADKKTGLAASQNLGKPNSSKLPSPIESVLGKERKTTPIYVTLNGMTQDNLPSHVLLRAADLNYISGNVVIEIDCDIMDPAIRGTFLTSTRERIKAEWERRLKADIEEFFKHEKDGKLGEINEEMRESFLRSSASEDTSVGMALFQRVMKSTVVGSLFSKFGLHTPLDGEANGKLKGTRVGGPTNRGGKPNRLGPHPEPFEIEIRKDVVKRGEVQYVTIRTDAFDDWDDAISLEVSSCLTIKHRRPLSDGRITYTIECDSNVLEGFKGKMVASLDRSRIKKIPITDECEFTVVRPNLREADIKPKNRTVLPDISMIPAEPYGKNWDQMLDSGEASEHIAFNFTQEQSGKIMVFFNSKFFALVEGMNSLSRKKATQPLTKSFQNDYKLALQMLVLSELETLGVKALDADGSVMRQLHLSRAAAVRAAVALILWQIERLGGNIGASAALDEAA